MFLYLVEFAVIALLFLFVVTQMLIPALFNRAFFPVFRRRAKLEREMIDVKERGDLAKMEADLEREKSQM